MLPEMLLGHVVGSFVSRRICVRPNSTIEFVIAGSNDDAKVKTPYWTPLSGLLSSI